MSLKIPQKDSQQRGPCFDFFCVVTTRVIKSGTKKPTKIGTKKPTGVSIFNDSDHFNNISKVHI